MSKRHQKTKMSIIAFQNKFNTEEKCREFLFDLRFPHGFVCPHCGSTEYGYIKSRHLCQCKQCRKQTSVTSGTIMAGTHISLTLWLWAMFLFANDKRGCSAIHLMRELSVTYKTAWFILHRLRIAMSNREEKYMLDGIVELDDTYIGASSHEKKRGRGTTKAKVIVGVSKTAEGSVNFVKMAVLPNLKGITIGKFASKNIKPDSHIESDNYHSYRKPLADKYFHKYETFSADKQMLVWVHTLISNLKAFINGTYHGIERKHMPLYLAEFCYRFNRRKSRENLFERLAFASVNS